MGSISLLGALMSNCPLVTKFEKNKPLHALCTWGIGGAARLFVEVHTPSELAECVRYAHETHLPFFILGKGSNLLFDDRGFDGIVIANRIGFCEREQAEGNKVRFHVGAGYSFSLLGTQTARMQLSGLEFAAGIPGSVGGAIYMNAGANGREVCEAVSEVTYVTESGSTHILKRSEISFGYRHSSFQEKKGAIASARFELDSSAEARQKQLQIIEYRTRTQPYGDLSAGCVFRNPPAASAGALIEQSGLKGVRIGGAEVSTLHANFLVNKGGATAQDILALAELVKRVVKEKVGVDLEMEVRCIPYQIEA